MVSLSRFHRVPVVFPWLVHGASVVGPCRLDGASACSHGVHIVLLLWAHGSSVVGPGCPNVSIVGSWYFHGDAVALSWRFGKETMDQWGFVLLPWRFRGAFMVSP